MAKFKWNDREFEVVENPMWPEIEWLESQLKRDYDNLTSTQKTRAVILLSLRRGGLMLKWDDLNETGPNDFEVIDDEDPTAAGGEAGAAPGSVAVLSGTPASGAPLTAPDVTVKTKPRGTSRRPVKRATSGGSSH